MLKIFELFAGVGAPRMALNALQDKGVLEYESLGYSEIDKYAILSYKAIHNDENNFGDITKIEELPQGIDILFHGSPCQDFSLAGKGLGAVEGTRSNLMFETVRLVEKALPKIIVWENVKGVLTKKHKHSFDNYVEQLSNLGYTSHYKVLNAKDHGIAQNRERIFCVSFLNDTSDFAFPKSKELTTCLRDYLDDYFTDDDIMWDPQNKEVPRGFEWVNGENGADYKMLPRAAFDHNGRIRDAENIASTLNTVTTEKTIDVIANVSNQTYESGKRILSVEGCAPTLAARDFKGPNRLLGAVAKKSVIATVNGINYGSDKRILNTEKYAHCLKASDGGETSTKKVIDVIAEVEGGSHDIIKRVYAVKGISNTLSTVQSGNSQTKIIDGIVIPANTKQGYIVAQNGDGVDLPIPSSKTRRGRVQHQSIHTLTTQGNLAACVNSEKHQLVIRKLKPIEYWRLMGFTDENFNKAKEVCSNSQLYKQAGNSIVVNVLVDLIEYIVKK